MSKALEGICKHGVICLFDQAAYQARRAAAAARYDRIRRSEVVLEVEGDSDGESNGSQKEKDVGKAAADEAQAAAAPAANNGSQEEKGDGKAAAHKALPAIFASQKEKKGYGTAAEVAALEEEASDNDEVAAGAEESSDDKPTAEV